MELFVKDSRPAGEVSLQICGIIYLWTEENATQPHQMILKMSPAEFLRFGHYIWSAGTLMDFKWSLLTEEQVA